MKYWKHVSKKMVPMLEKNKLILKRNIFLHVDTSTIIISHVKT